MSRDMSRYIVNQAYPATPAEIERWEREAGYYVYHPGHPNAPTGSTQAATWGVPTEYMPPRDAVEFVIARFKREVAEVPLSEKLRPEFKFGIINVSMAHFLWLRTKAGAAWLLRFYGIEEVTPFWDGYAYVYVDPSSKTAARITKDCGLELRIFARRERDLSPPVTSESDQTIEEMSALLNRHRDPTAFEPSANVTSGMYHWVSEQLRDWFHEPTPDKQWPSPKPNRISGYQWAKTLRRNQSVLFYDALDKMDLYKDRAYRIKDPNARDPSGGVLWTGSDRMQILPLPDLYRHEGMSEHQIDNIFRCFSCGKLRPCLPVTGDQKMCCECYGTHIERDARPTLSRCLMRECRACPAHLDSLTELVVLKNRLNRDTSRPVRR